MTLHIPACENICNSMLTNGLRIGTFIARNLAGIREFCHRAVTELTFINRAFSNFSCFLCTNQGRREAASQSGS